MSTRSVGIRHNEKGSVVSIVQDAIGGDLTALRVVGGMIERVAFARSNTGHVYGLVPATEDDALRRLFGIAAVAIQAKVNADESAKIVAARSTKKSGVTR